MTKWKYVFHSWCVPCDESGGEPYGEMYDETIFDTKEEAEAYLTKMGGAKHTEDDYAVVKRWIEEVQECNQCPGCKGCGSVECTGYLGDTDVRDESCQICNGSGKFEVD